MSGSALAILTAAGSGVRLGCEGPKALVEVGGVPMLVRAANGLAAAGISGIVVTAPPDQVERFASLFQGDATGSGVAIEVVAGSDASRQASVARGLAALPRLAARIGARLDEFTPVLVHDAARCLAPVDAIRRVVDAVESGQEAVIPAVPVTDTLKEVGAPIEGPDARPVVSTPDRSTLVAVQTPQGFAWERLRLAHESAASRASSEATAATDDAGLVEALGGRVVVVEGSHLSLKITTAVDLALAELLLARAE